MEIKLPLIARLRKRYGHVFHTMGYETMCYDLSDHPLIQEAISALNAVELNQQSGEALGGKPSTLNQQADAEPQDPYAWVNPDYPWDIQKHKNKGWRGLFLAAPNLDALIAQERATFGEEITRLKQEVEELKHQHFAHFNNADCWIYQGDGTDNLESLVCPVVISATDLMAFKEQAKQGVSQELENGFNEWFVNEYGLAPKHARAEREAFLAGAAAERAKGVKAGWQLVPKEPTEEMMMAGMNESPLCIKRMYARDGDSPRYTGQVSGFSQTACGEIYREMLAAAPTQEKP